MTSLFVIKGRDQGRKFELDSSTLRLGRDNTNAIHINDREASRVHAEVRRSEDNEYEVVDLESSNGTFVNEIQISRQPLQNGDRVRIGKTVFIFTTSSSPQNLNPAELVRIIQNPLPESGSQIVRSIRADVSKRIDLQKESAAAAQSNTGFELVYHAALAVSQTLDIDQLIEKLLQMIFEAVSPDRGCILLAESETGEMIPRITRSRNRGDSKQQIEISRSIVEYVVENREGVITSDAMNDERWDSQASILKMGVCEAICVPMQGRYGTQGVIYIDTRTTPGEYASLNSQNQFSDEHLKMMIAIGHQAALAIEDTNFYSAMIQSERMAAMGQTIAMLSHHIKNILQGLNGGSYLVREGLKQKEFEVVESGWKIVEKNQGKISQLVMDMLSFSKERAPDLVPGNINDVIRDVVELIQHRAAEAGIGLTWKEQPTLPEAAFDPEAVHRALLNVVSNAIDACQDRTNKETVPDYQGQVTIRCEINEARQSIDISVEDNAGGIPDDELDKIFLIFESGKGHRGTGLGLPVSRKIMREHGGDIEVESTLGEGSAFCLYFPFRNAIQEHPTIEIPGASNS